MAVAMMASPKMAPQSPKLLFEVRTIEPGNAWQRASSWCSGIYVSGSAACGPLKFFSLFLGLEEESP